MMKILSRANSVRLIIEDYISDARFLMTDIADESVMYTNFDIN